MGSRRGKAKEGEGESPAQSTEQPQAAQQNVTDAPSQEGPTTRDDPLDLGVDMQPGDPAEPQGAEDAFGPGPKRGDYTRRVGGEDYHPHTSVPIPESEREEGGPHTRLVPQRDRVAEQGDEAGLKGGVETSE